MAAPSPSLLSNVIDVATVSAVVVAEFASNPVAVVGDADASADGTGAGDADTDAAA